MTGHDSPRTSGCAIYTIHQYPALKTAAVHQTGKKVRRPGKELLWVLFLLAKVATSPEISLCYLYLTGLLIIGLSVSNFCRWPSKWSTP